MITLAWPIAVLVIAVLAYRVAQAVLTLRAAERTAQALHDDDRATIAALAAQVRDFDAALKQMRNTQTLAGQRRGVTGI